MDIYVGKTFNHTKQNKVISGQVQRFYTGAGARAQLQIKIIKLPGQSSRRTLMSKHWSVYAAQMYCEQAYI